MNENIKTPDYTALARELSIRLFKLRQKPHDNAMEHWEIAQALRDAHRQGVEEMYDETQKLFRRMGGRIGPLVGGHENLSYAGAQKLASKMRSDGLAYPNETKATVPPEWYDMAIEDASKRRSHFTMLTNSFKEKKKEMTNKNIQELLEKSVQKKMEYIAKNKEKLLEAWIAETGLLPSESMLVTEDIQTHDKITTRTWVISKKDFDTATSPTMNDERDTQLQLILKEAFDGGLTDGAHHKQHRLDQILHIILEDRYEEWLREQCYQDDEEFYHWDVGIP